jgi:type III pantothenate kinase
MTGILDIDVGNSRVKWRVGGDGGRRGAFRRADGWLDSTWTKTGFDPARIRISSVAGARANDELRRALRERFGITPQFAKPVRARGGVTCGYRTPSQMGVDRWLGLLAARQLVPGSFVVVGIGTAATLDFVDHAGLHCGGYIVPGLAALIRALGSSTAQVQIGGSRTVPESLAPGVDTRECVERGTARMLVDFVEQSIARFLRNGEHDASIVMTGGDASAVSAHLSRPHRYVPDLVLDGLAVALP